jgi:hypothetical protein
MWGKTCNTRPARSPFNDMKTMEPYHAVMHAHHALAAARGVNGTGSWLLFGSVGGVGMAGEFQWDAIVFEVLSHVCLWTAPICFCSCVKGRIHTDEAQRRVDRFRATVLSLQL